MSFGATATLTRTLDRVALDHERRPPDAGREDLLAEVRVIRREASLLNLPQLEEIAALREGELLLALGDARGALSVLTNCGETAAVLARTSEALLALGDLRGVLDVSARGIELVERDRDKTSAAYMQASYLRRTISLYANGVRAAYELRDSRMLGWMERSKGRLIRASRPPEDARARLADLGERIDAARDPETEVALRIRRRALFDRLLGAHRRPAPVFDLAEVQAALAPGQRALSHYWLDRDRLLSVVVTRDDVIAQADEILPEAALEAQRLIVSPHRSLHEVMWTALPVGGQPLIRRMAVATGPNLTCLQTSFAPSSRVLAVGVNEYARARALPLAEEAAAEIADLYGGEALLGAVATEAALRQALSTPVGCLHLTLHGADVDSDTPLESWLELGATRLDGLDLIGWDLEGTTVVLAACSAGQRAVGGRGMPELPGDDVFGLQAAFFAAGARQILCALTPVEFRVARMITRAFHVARRAGFAADLALQRALVDHLDTARILDRDTRYWAPFTLVCAGAPA